VLGYVGLLTLVMSMLAGAKRGDEAQGWHSDEEPRDRDAA
jgi:hypothetical protein